MTILYIALALAAIFGYGFVKGNITTTKGNK
jgi:hypothetical protein